MQALEKAIATLLSSNFDADSKTCLLTSIKILDNVLHRPGDTKVRVLKLSNAAFHGKVGCRAGGIEILQACGFAVVEQAVPLLSKVDSGERVLELQNEDQSHLMAARQLMATRLVSDLHMEADQVPPFRAPPKLSTNGTAGAAPFTEPTFDVYRGSRFDGQSAAVGANLGPDANYVSSTDQQLELLRRQQAQLESRLQKPIANRQWRVTLPPQQEQQQPATTTPESDTIITSSSKGDASLLAQHVQKQHAARHKLENGPLTTRAMRDVERLKRQKVYAHVNLTLQFPDGIKLTGQFLPRETVGSVIATLRSECLINTMEGHDEILDLYMTPPRQLLDRTKTLQEHNLVPAAKVFVSWKQKATPPTTTKLYSYIRPELLRPMSSSSADSHTTTAYPMAAPIVGDDRKPPPPESSSASQPAMPGNKKDREGDLLKRMMGKK